MVRVAFVDADSGAELARSVLPAEQLPSSFEPGTTVAIGDTSYLVEDAAPARVSDAVAAGELTLRLRRLELASAQDVLFSLPSIAESVPASTAHTNGRGRFDIHEDDWRQLEFVDSAQLGVVERELAAVRAVFESESVRGDDGRLIGFRTLHVRHRPESPLAVARQGLLGRWPEIGTAPVLALRGEAGGVEGSFALGCGHLVLYGVGDDTIRVLGLQFRRSDAAGPAVLGGLADLMRDADLMLVDWCRCAVVPASELITYLDALTG